LHQNFLASRTRGDVFLHGNNFRARERAFMKRGQRRSIQALHGPDRFIRRSLRVRFISRASCVATQMSL
jgi:hypothetical protein